MKLKKIGYLILIFAVTTILSTSCTKSSGGSASLYIPTSADITSNATLDELTNGRALYVANCNSCHDLYNPDSYTPTQWKSILNSMGPKSGMSASQILLVTKYLCRGNQ
jgi:hypothetical protein